MRTRPQPRSIAAFAVVTLLAACTAAPQTDSRTVLAISVAPANPTLTQGGSLAFSATAFLQDGEQKDVTRDPDTKWTSSNASVVQISNDGSANALNPGQAQITASHGTLNSPPQTVTVQGTPPPTPTPTPAPTANHVVISEVMYDTPHTEPDTEYIELHNPTAGAINVQGWKIGNHGDAMASPYTIQAAVSIAPGGYYTICHATAATCQGQFMTGIFDTGGISFTLVNSPGDWIELRDGANALVDQMAYGSGYNSTKPASWCATNAPTATANSVSRKPVNSDGDNCNDWVGNAVASPGAATP